MKKIYLSLFIALAGTVSVNAQSTPCGAVSGGNIGDLDCADLGTANYGTEVPTANFTTTSATAPSGTSDCGVAYSGTGSWTHYTMDDAVNILNYGFEGGSVGKGYKENYMAFFQGPDCSTLTSVGCVNAIYFNKGNLYINTPEVVEPVDGTQDLWVYNWNNDGKAHNLNWSLPGSSDGLNAGEDCANAIPASDGMLGCNLGAPGETWNGPSSYTTCSGGTWYSNENTVYYTVTATSDGGAQVDITNILCNDGSTADDFLQVGVWTGGCAAVGATTSYSNGNFLGCAAGTGGVTVSFTADAGVEYIIALDGNAGDICQWGFDITNLEPTPLSSNDIVLSLKKASENNASLSWFTSNENVSEFIVEKNVNNAWVSIGSVPFALSGSNYKFIDEEASFGMVYYRIKEINKDGTTFISNMKSINFNVKNTPNVVYNPNTSQVDIIVGGNEAGDYSYNLYDVAGKLIDERTFSVQGSERAFSFDASVATQKGIYFVLIRDNNTNEGYTFKFAK